MGQSVRNLLAAAVAIVSTCLTAAAVDAETPSAGLLHDGIAQGRIFDREVSTLLLPQFRGTDTGAASRRRPKPTTLLQVDAPIGENGDLMFRVQAKQKQFLFLEFRF